MAALPSASDREPIDERALRVALEGRDEARETAAELGKLRQSIGTAPNPVTGAKAEEGTMWHAVAQLQLSVGNLRTEIVGRLDALTASVEADRRARDDERRAHQAVQGALAERSAPWSKLGWIVLAATVGPTMAAIVGAVVYLLTRRP